MEVANNETDLEINYNSEASTGDKRKREGKSRSKVWEHFTKLIKEDGGSDKCLCYHCQKTFSRSSRSGTTHLLRHIADGICPVLNKEKGRTVPIPSHLRGGTEQKTSHLHWKFDQGLGQSSIPQCLAVEIEPLVGRIPKESALFVCPLNHAEDGCKGSCIVGIPCDIVLIYDGAVMSSLQGNGDAKQVNYAWVGVQLWTPFFKQMCCRVEIQFGLRSD